jgi:hypothetical protein
MSDLDVLRTLRDQVVPPPLDTLRETARRRGRTATVAGAVAAAAAVAVVVTTTVLSIGGDGDGTQPPPVDTTDPGSSTRPLTYADGDVLHYGDRTIDADGQIVELDLTDQGVALRTVDGRIWFTDGTTVEQVGDVGLPGSAYTGDVWPLLVHDGWLVSAHSGSLVAWFEFAGPGGPPVAVVYDTSTREVLARDRATADLETVALPYLVTDRYFYWFVEPDPEVEAIDTPQVRFDPRTGQIVPVSDAQVQDDLRNQGPSRTILIGSGEEDDAAPRITDGTDRNFAAAGGRITAQGGQPLVAEDGATGTPLELDAPPDYPRTDFIWLTQWIDSDTVVFVSTVPRGDDLLECRVSTGGCQVVLSGPESLVLPEIG